MRQRQTVVAASHLISKMGSAAKNSTLASKSAKPGGSVYERNSKKLALRAPGPDPVRAPLSISPIAVIQTIKVNLLRRPLWRLTTAQECLDKSRDEVTAMVESGELPWAWDLGLGRSRREIRVLSASVVEKSIGPIPNLGSTQNLQLSEVLDLVLPKRDLRSTELTRIFGCSHQQVGQLAPHFAIVKQSRAADGPDSYKVFSWASVATFLKKRRVT